MKRILTGPALLLAFTLAAIAAPTAFDFKDPKGVNNVVFQLDAPLESINGTATGVAGKLDFDPANPATLKGSLTVATATMHVGNPMMKDHLHGEMWMDVAKFPEIKFVSESVANVKTNGNTATADVTGTLTIRDKSKKITLPVTLTYLKDKLADRIPQMSGDILVLRASFEVKRSDFGVNQGQMEDKVSDAIKLTLSLAGIAPK